MTKGVLIFALNDGFDYQSIAYIAAKRVKQHLQLPITMVTNVTPPDNIVEIFDKIIIRFENFTQTRTVQDGQESNKINWLNFSRFSAYELTPYDETLVIDADYLINTDFLKICFEINKDFLIYKDSFDVSYHRLNSEFEYINEFSIPFYWATVFYFKKTKLNESFFKLIEFIRDNWQYYRLLYQITESKFRNDFAFSIAIHLLHKHILSEKFYLIPGKMIYSLDKDILVSLTNNSCKILTAKKSSIDEYIMTKITNDIHVMNKHSILRAIE